MKRSKQTSGTEKWARSRAATASATPDPDRRGNSGSICHPYLVFRIGPGKADFRVTRAANVSPRLKATDRRFFRHVSRTLPAAATPVAIYREGAPLYNWRERRFVRVPTGVGYWREAKWVKARGKSVQPFETVESEVS